MMRSAHIASGLRAPGGGGRTGVIAMRSSRRGITLVELIVALIITALIASAAAATVSQMVKSRNAAAERRAAFQRAERAGMYLLADLREIARDADLVHSRVMVSQSGGNSEILLLVRGERTVRGIDGLPEGADFEVQYRVDPQGRLMRRIDPSLDEAIDGGGIVTTVAEGVGSLSIAASDGESWLEVWDSDTDGLPHAVRIVVQASAPTGGAGRQRSAAYRGVIALDRVPIPVETVESTETTDGGTGA